MAERPIFVPNPESDELVKEVFLQLIWSPGFALVQKEKNIEALHKAAEADISEFDVSLLRCSAISKMFRTDNGSS